MPVRYYPRWRDVPASEWPWANFSPSEIACRGTGRLKVDTEAMDKLQSLRERIGRPLIVTSAYRSPEHNRKVGGKKNSKHLDGTAFDVSMANHDPQEFEAHARSVGFKGFGYYPGSGFIHIDLGPARSWGKPFPPRPRYAVEERPAEAVTSSRTVAGSTAAAGGGVLVLAEAVSEVQRAESALSGGSIMGLVIGGLILAGALYALYARWDDAGRPSLRDVFGRSED